MFQILTPSAISHVQRGLAGLAALAVVAGAALVFAPDRSTAQEEAPTVSVEELMKPGDLADLSIGAADAKVVMVEYFSMTCPHCADFANKVLPELKKKYVDSGKMRIIFREFPHNNRAFAVSMLARCVGDDKAVTMIEGLFETQSDWAFKQDNPGFKQALLEVAKQSGFTQESFDKCLTDQALLDKLVAQHKRAIENFGISRIPTIFLNGTKVVGEPSLANVEKTLEPMLAKN